jgi:acetyltransferase-like isoleucine patch superfamily enzyme
MLRYWGGFGDFGVSSVDVGVRFDNPGGIHIGDGVLVLHGSWLYCIPTDGPTPELRIGANVYIGYRCHITCARRVEIGPGCFFSNNVLITDTMHQYEDIQIDPLRQPLAVAEVQIGEGTMIGENACVFGRVMIGRHCVIGANSLVSNCEVPNYSVVVGSPARLVKRYDTAAREWRRVAPPEPLSKRW